jgi:DNA-binding NtrC family response regulator
MKTIFMVDDSMACLSMAKRTLEGRYEVKTLPSAMKMLAFLKKRTPA